MGAPKKVGHKPPPPPAPASQPAKPPPKELPASATYQRGVIPSMVAASEARAAQREAAALERQARTRFATKARAQELPSTQMYEPVPIGANGKDLHALQRAIAKVPGAPRRTAGAQQMEELLVEGSKGRKHLRFEPLFAVKERDVHQLEAALRKAGPKVASQFGIVRYSAGSVTYCGIFSGKNIDQLGQIDLAMLGEGKSAHFKIVKQ